MTHRNKSEGFTLVELMIVVAIVGVLAVIAVVGVRRYLANAKSSEARHSLGAIGKGAALAFERETTVTTVLGAATTAVITHRLCISASEKVPVSVASISGRQWQPDNANGVAFHKDDGAVETGFACLRFDMPNPIAYQYDYTSDATPTTQGSGVTATAIGDLNGDGVTSRFRLFGGLQSQVLVLAPSLEEANPDE